MFTSLFALALLSSASNAAAAEKTPPREGGGLFFPPVVEAAPRLELGAVLPQLTQLPQTAQLPPLEAPAVPAAEAPAAAAAAAPSAGPSAAFSGLQALQPGDRPAAEAVSPAAAFDGAGKLPAGGDLSGEYHAARAVSAARFSPREPELERLRGYKVLLVPGFMSGAFIRLSQALGRDPQPWHYFGPQMRWLSELGVEHELVAVHTEQTIEHNARVIEDRVRASRKPVLILSHSKGGLDTLEALLNLRKDGVDKVHGWIPVQSPFLGSPGADRVADNPVLRFWVSLFLEHPSVGGSKHSLLRMTTTAAQDYFERRKAEVAAVLAAVPTVAFTSWKQARVVDVLQELTGLGLNLNPFLKPKLFFSPLLGLTVIVKAVGETLTWLAARSDGLVPPEKARLPGMHFVEEEGVDHFVPFIDHGGAFDRLGFTKALLKMVLRRAPAR